MIRECYSQFQRALFDDVQVPEVLQLNRRLFNPTWHRNIIVHTGRILE